MGRSPRKESIAGDWIVNVKSPEEAREWPQRVPGPHGENAEE